jgi:hypothetical protein
MRQMIVTSNRDISDMNDLDPNCFGLRQADQAREAYAQVMEELDLVRSSWPGSRRGARPFGSPWAPRPRS